MYLLKITGNLTTDKIEDFKKAIEDCFNTKKFSFALDLSAVQVMCSTAIGIMISAYKKAKTSGGDIVLIVPELNRELQQVFTITRLNTIFRIVTSANEL